MTPKHFFLFLLTFFSLCATAQITPAHLTTAQIPKEIQYIAKVEDALSWKDSSGSYVLVLTETGSHVSHSGESFGNDAELHAYSYVKRGTAYLPVWTMHDFIKECQVDISAEYISNAASFTDLDHDGTAEVWLVYRTACRGDVSPATMKIVMHEGKAKYLVKGTTRVKVSKISYEGGDMTFDEAFNAAPESFREHAKKLWSEHVTETWE
jgi:hypothetical protein